MDKVLRLKQHLSMGDELFRGGKMGMNDPLKC